MGGTGTKGDATCAGWCWERTAETQRVTQQVCLLLGKGCKEEPYLWVVWEKPGVDRSLTSLSSPISHWPSLSPWRGISPILSGCVIWPPLASFLKGWLRPPHSDASPKVMVKVTEVSAKIGGSRWWECEEEPHIPICVAVANSPRIVSWGVRLSPKSDFEDLTVHRVSLPMTFTLPGGEPSKSSNTGVSRVQPKKQVLLVAYFHKVVFGTHWALFFTYGLRLLLHDNGQVESRHCGSQSQKYWLSGSREKSLLILIVCLSIQEYGHGGGNLICSMDSWVHGLVEKNLK